MQGEHGNRQQAAARGAAGPIDIPGLERGDGLPGRIIRGNGASQRVMICYLEGGLRIEGAEGIADGERLLLQLPDSRAYEIVTRWVAGDQAGAIVLG